MIPLRLVVPLVVLALAGCGQADDGDPLAREDAAALTVLLADARQAAAQNDPEGTRDALREFRRTLGDLERLRRIHPADADVLRRAARQAEDRVEDAVPAPQESEPDPPQQEEPPEPPAEDEDGDDGGDDPGEEAPPSGEEAPPSGEGEGDDEGKGNAEGKGKGTGKGKGKGNDG